MNLRLLASAAALALAGCGGGGGSGASIALADLQGFWNGPIAGADFGDAAVVRSVVLEDGRAWLFLHGAGTGEPLVGLATAQLAVSGEQFSGTGTRYDATGAIAEAASVTGQPTAGGLSMKASHKGSTALSTMDLEADSRYDKPAVAADVVGTWNFTQADGTIEGTWTIAAGGALSGTRTSGCTYSGKVVPHGGVAVYDVSVTETCAGDPARTLSGIAKLNTAKTFLTFGLTTSDAAEGTAFAVERAPI
jgi:hypothetical protein